MKIYIKNMVCPRCITAVGNILDEINVKPLNISLGEVETTGDLDKETIGLLSRKLEAVGFELLNNEQQELVEKIKGTVIELIYNDKEITQNFSSILSEKLHKDYSFLSKLFSAVECMTIEHYIILQKTERAKELLAYGQYTLSQIAFMLGYSSVAHLSTQFKKITGMTPSQFKKNGMRFRKSIDNL